LLNKVFLEAVKNRIKALGMIWLNIGIYRPNDSFLGISMAVLTIFSIKQIIPLPFQQRL